MRPVLPSCSIERTDEKSFFDERTLIGGLCIYLFGMDILDTALERICDHCAGIAGRVPDSQNHGTCQTRPHVCAKDYFR